MYVHIHVRVRQLSPQVELLNCVEFRPAGFSLARVRFDFSKVSNMELSTIPTGPEQQILTSTKPGTFTEQGLEPRCQKLGVKHPGSRYGRV